MAPIKFSRIVSYSSEDPVHKVDNLLKPESTKKWKCKTMGEKQATAILQLSRQVQINSVDIGNEYSAFVEVFAAKSSTPDEYKVLLPAVCMMSIQDSKQGVGINSVRFFKSESLLHADETWDRIKVVCSQPYNKCVQYGLAFITVHSVADNKDETPTLDACSSTEAAVSSQMLGNFVLKDEPAETSPISRGNWFSKRKAISPPREYVKVPKTSLASSIKEDSSPGLVKADKPKKIKRKTDDFSGRIEVKAPEKDGSARRATRGPLLYVSDEDEDCKASVGQSEEKKDSKGRDKNKDSKKLASKVSDEKKDIADRKDSNPQRTKDSRDSKNNHDTKNFNNDPTPSSTTSGLSKKQTKPFNRLLEGVTFVISGFENPLRGDLRNQALEMGAFYKANWDRTCTHLVCAFPNTPKCRSVQSLNGKIVTKDWIADCYNHCKRLPWRRYALLRSDQAESESEEEIAEEKPDPLTSRSRVLLGTASTGHSNDSELQSTSTRNNASQATSNNLSDDDTDTDIDETAEFGGKLQSRVFTNIFQGLSFLVHASIEETLRDKLFRYVTTYGGHCSCDGLNKHTPIPKPSLNNHWDYILAETLNQDEEMKYINSKWINSDWIWECVNQNQLVPNQKYMFKIKTNQCTR